MDGWTLCGAGPQGNGQQAVCSRLEEKRGEGSFLTLVKFEKVRVMAWTVNSPLEKATMRHMMGVQVLTDTLDR